DYRPGCGYEGGSESVRVRMMIVHENQNLVRSGSCVRRETGEFMPAVRSANLRPSCAAAHDRVDEGILPVGVDAQTDKAVEVEKDWKLRPNRKHSLICHLFGESP